MVVGTSSSTLFTTAFAALLTALFVSSVSAQMLDLDRPSPPVLNEPTAIDLAIESLVEESRRLGRRLEVPPRVEAQIGVRTLAANLLRLSTPHAQHWGQTIAQRLGAIDAILLDDQIPEAVAFLLIADLDVPAFDLPSETADLDRFIRDAFAELSTHALAPQARIGWVGPPESPATLAEFLESLSRWELAGVVGPQLAADLRDLTGAAESWPAYAGSARALQSLILRGARLIEQSTLSEGAQQEARARFARAVGDALSPELQERAFAELRELSDLGIMLEQAQALANRDAAKAVMMSIEQSLVSDAMMARPPDFTLARTILALLAERKSLPQEDTIVRALRPAWRALSSVVRQSEIDLSGVVPMALTETSAMSDPGVLAPLGMHRAALDDLRIVLLANELLEDPGATAREAVVRDDRRALAARILEIGQALGDPASADRATRTLRDLGEQLAVLDRLRGCVGNLSSLTSDTQSSLTDEIELTRGAWIDAWSNDRADDLDQIMPRLELLADLCERVADLTVLTDGPLCLHAWPAFELSPRLARIITQQAGDRLEQTATVLLASELTRARDRLETYADEHRVLILLARVERGLRARGLVRDPGVLDLVAGTPAPNAWLADLREPLTELSLLLAEIEGARERNEPRGERDIRAYANYLAERSIEIIAGDSQ